MVGRTRSTRAARGSTNPRPMREFARHVTVPIGGVAYAAARPATSPAAARTRPRGRRSRRRAPRPSPSTSRAATTRCSGRSPRRGVVHDRTWISGCWMFSGVRAVAPSPPALADDLQRLVAEGRHAEASVGARDLDHVLLHVPAEVPLRGAERAALGAELEATLSSGAYDEATCGHLDHCGAARAGNPGGPACGSRDPGRSRRRVLGAQAQGSSLGVPSQRRCV